MQVCTSLQTDNHASTPPLSFYRPDALPVAQPTASNTEGTGKINEKLKSENMQKRAVFLCLHYILRAIRAGRCRERRYADHIYSYIYFRMHHFVVKFSKFSSPQAARGH